MPRMNGFDLWRQEQSLCKIITLCQDLDKSLCGGIKTNLITEFCGFSGTGKTQLCMQLCVTVQFPEKFGGLAGEAIYIDTNQNFSPQRQKELAEHISKRLRYNFEDDAEVNQSCSTDHFLNRIEYVYCPSSVSLLAFLNQLRGRFINNPKVKLIVIDSFSFVMRQIKDESHERNLIIYQILTDLHKLAKDFDIAVVITNDLTTKFDGNEWKISPALSDSYSHKINQRIILSSECDSNVRWASIDKSVTSPKVEVCFQIKETGVYSMKTS